MEQYYLSAVQVKNKLLLRFLLAATIVFVFVLGVTYWRQQNIVEVTPAPMIVPEKGFSDFDTSSDLTKAYAFNTKVVNDIEAYPELKALFFSARTNFLKDKSVKVKSLARIKDLQKEATDLSDKHVYNTSFYVGNLLVLPDLTLHELLLNNERTNTSILLETALADVRGGVVKIQDYFNQATPSQIDKSITSQLYFKNPSFPNLTTAEALTVLYLLAEDDVVNSRMYEMYARQYVNHVLFSGGVFDYDVEYAVYLVEAYHQIFLRDEYYKSLIVNAKLEWQDSTLVAGDIYIESKIPLKGFPYQSNFSIANVVNNNYKVEPEKIGGSLMLSLIDNRLPNPHQTLYQYNFSEDSLLPFAIDLSKRKFPSLGTDLKEASYYDKNNYVFISDNDIYYYRNNDLEKITNTPELSKTELEISHDGSKLAWSQSVSEGGGDSNVVILNLVGNVTRIEEVIAKGESPHFAFNDAGVVYLKDNQLHYYDLSEKKEETILDLSQYVSMSSSQYSSVNYKYFDNNQAVVAYINYFDIKSLLPKTQVLVYRLSKDQGKVTPILSYQATLSDIHTSSLSLSSGGGYLAMAVTETASGRLPKVLIFDIISGIIIKEIPLDAFATDFLVIDGWTIFN